MPKRGIPGCPRYCNNCAQDCTCETCGYCHSCSPQNAYSTYGRNHTWQHNCKGKGPGKTTISDSAEISKFLKDTSNRFMKFCISEVYTIKIGEGKTYYIHTETLRQTSPVFKKYIEAQMKETSTKTIELKDEEIVDNDLAFNLFVQFCYFGTYGYDDSGKEDAFQVHALVYIFAEKFEVLELKLLALKKATLLCSNAVSDTSATSLVKVLQFVLPETVPIIYGGTFDANTGNYPSTFNETSEKDTIAIPTIKRDGFRMLLAKFAALYIENLRQNEAFTKVLEEHPAFGIDVLLFTGAGSQLSTDGKASLEF